MADGDAASRLSSENVRRDDTGDGGTDRGVPSDSVPDTGGAGTRSPVG
jgi:hypothetical protein